MTFFDNSAYFGITDNLVIIMYFKISFSSTREDMILSQYLKNHWFLYIDAVESVHYS